MLVVRDAKQSRSEKYACRKIEGARRFFSDQAPYLIVPIDPSWRSKVNRMQKEIRLRDRPL
jgi:hypothetical protein